MTGTRPPEAHRTQPRTLHPFRGELARCLVVARLTPCAFIVSPSAQGPDRLSLQTRHRQNGTSMRLALALFLAILAAAPGAAQQARPGQPGPSNPPAPLQQEVRRARRPRPPSRAKPRRSLRQRILLREKFNKGWEVQDEDPRQRRARCKSEARKRFTAMHPLKRRKFQKECMAQAGR